MIVMVAETGGFCMGVALALRKLDTMVEQGGTDIFTLGPIIHNPQVLQDYERLGVRIAKSPEDIPSGAAVIIRAHGIPREVQQELKAKDVTLVDATCPKVKKAQLLIAEQTDKGRRLLLFGEEDHPEVKGLVSYAGESPLVFGDLEELMATDLPPEVEYFLAAQTTQDKETFSLISDHLHERLGQGLPVLATICDATKERQEEAVAIAREVDAMVVAGGFSSGNTRRLVDVVRAQGTQCYHVETVDQIPTQALCDVAAVGLTAGASTPKMIIDDICAKLQSL
ncbi:MAG: 4-hydroxy-3-methylbut-2-enyl diphosphate reductase [Desulfovibrio sp.]|nr:MAG: 4-hydroxy-3-methylbut-2-enyl diphosphate reductase [Desulfovibrio sp.]